jgi:DNA-nicking Smr family endonuclease
VTSKKKAPATFRELMATVRPLAPGSRRVPPPAGPAFGSPPGRVGAAFGSPPAPPSAGRETSFGVKDDGSTIEGARTGREALIRELRRGDFPVVDSLDLHGLSSAQAERALRRFCERTRGSRALAVLVVHGKGAHSPGGRGVLRDEIAGWLSSAALAHRVLAFVTARPKDGGGGAVYVLLARR